MLKQIQCDAFKINNTIRPAIEFNNFNIIRGDTNAKNSIGKSTFLMIIDFAFGGKDYANKFYKNGIKEFVGEHIINFKFVFDKEYYFSRNPEKVDEVNVCDSNYNIVSNITLDEYTDFLKRMYDINTIELSFRQIVSCFFRIWKRASDASQPLKNYDADSMKNGVTKILELFDCYKKIANEDLKVKEAKDELDTTKKYYKYTTSPKNEKEVNENIQKIAELKELLNNIASYANNDKSGKEILSKYQNNELELAAKDLRSLKFKLINEKKKYLFNLQNSKVAIQKDFKKIQEFFPNAEYAINKIEEIEKFHENIYKSLKNQIEDRISNIEFQISQINLSLAEIDNKRNALLDKADSNISVEQLNDYANVKMQIEKLERENEKFYKLSELKEVVSNNTETIKNEMNAIMEEINTKLSEAINEFRRKLDLPDKTIFKIISRDKYEFNLVDDYGHGSTDKNTILFDMALLTNTNLPAIIHDSDYLKLIEDTSFKKLIGIYKSIEKQSFISIDKNESYYTKDNEDALKDIFKECTVLELKDGEELFGKAWTTENKK